jgi:hypothetical protein
LQNELNAFNERIAELEDEGHRGHAMEVLKANGFHSAILAGRMATPSLLNTEDNEKSFANVSEVAGNSRIKT